MLENTDNLKMYKSNIFINLSRIKGFCIKLKIDHVGNLSI